MQKILRALLLICFIFLFGCNSALLGLQEDNKNMANRISQKQADLIMIQAENQNLADEKNRLLQELDQKNITLDELSAQVDKLKEANSQIKAVTEAERTKKAKLSRSLDDYSRKIKTLNSDDHLDIEEKMKRSEELKQQIKDKLKRDSELFAN